MGVPSLEAPPDLPRPSVLVFDVNETLSDLAPMAERLVEVGLPAESFAAWFASVLRDGVGLAAAAAYADFADLARDDLRLMMRKAGLEGTDAAIDHVVSGFGQAGVHPDVPAGLRALQRAGFRLVTLTNGSVAVTEALLGAAGLRDCFELLLDVTVPRRWKPAPEAYQYAVTSAGVAPAEAMLVAVHPWDVDGALRAGLRAAWLHRGVGGDVYPRTLLAPTWVGRDLAELSAQLIGAER